jgi:hypothetical protein
MAADMVDLIEFLRARLDERERDARDVAKLAAEHQAWMAGLPGWPEPADGEPNANVLAYLDTKRQIIEQYEATAQAVYASRGTTLAVAARARLCAYDEVLRLLALPYAGHPDYREEWRT